MQARLNNGSLTRLNAIVQRLQKPAVETIDLESLAEERITITTLS